MKLFKTPSLYLILIALIVSCSFSTTGQAVNQQNPVVNEKKQTVLKVDTASKYVVAAKPTIQEQRKRDSLLRVYIGSIVKPYIDDLKDNNNKQVTSLVDIIRSQNFKMDSLDSQRRKESKFSDSNSASRDSLTQVLILKTRSNDSLRKVIVQLNKVDKTTTQIVNTFSQIWTGISVFGNIMLYLIIIYGLIQLGLTIAIYLKTRRNNLSKYHA